MSARLPAEGEEDGDQRREAGEPLPPLPLDGRLRVPTDANGDEPVGCIATADPPAVPPGITPCRDLVVGRGGVPGAPSSTDTPPTLPAGRGDPAALPVDPRPDNDSRIEAAAAAVPADERPESVGCGDVPPLKSRTVCTGRMVPPCPAANSVAVRVLPDEATEPVLPPDIPPLVAEPDGNSRGDAATAEPDAPELRLLPATSDWLPRELPRPVARPSPPPRSPPPYRAFAPSPSSTSAVGCDHDAEPLEPLQLPLPVVTSPSDSTSARTRRVAPTSPLLPSSSPRRAAPLAHPPSRLDKEPVSTDSSPRPASDGTPSEPDAVCAGEAARGTPLAEGERPSGGGVDRRRDRPRARVGVTTPPLAAEPPPPLPRVSPSPPSTSTAAAAAAAAAMASASAAASAASTGKGTADKERNESVPATLSAMICSATGAKRPSITISTRSSPREPLTVSRRIKKSSADITPSPSASSTSIFTVPA